MQHQTNGIAVKHTEIAMLSKTNEPLKTEIKGYQEKLCFIFCLYVCNTGQMLLTAENW